MTAKHLPPTATIVVDHGRAIVHASATADVRLVLPELEYHSREFRSDGNGLSCVSSVLEFHARDHRGRLDVRPGLVPLVMTLLGSRGIAVQVEDRRTFPPELAPDAEALAGASGPALDLMRAVAAEPRGQLAVGGIEGQAWAILRIRDLFPTLQILVMTATRRHAHHLSRRLSEHLGRRVRDVQGQWDARQPVVICPYTFLKVPDDWHVLVFADGRGLANAGAVDRIASADPESAGHPRRVYALSPAGGLRSRRDSLAAQWAAGPVIYSPRPLAVPVRVVLCPVASRVATRGMRGLTYKRAAVWSNDRRNAVVATAAVAVANKDMPKLWALGVLLDEAEDVPDAFGDRPDVTILVEGLEHGREILRHLPDAELFSTESGSMAAPVAIEVDDDVRSRVSVVTVSYAARFGISTDVLVRADGGGGPPSVKNFPPDRGGVRRQVLLVDFDDDLDARSGSETLRRLRHYRAKGWCVPSRRRGTVQDQSSDGNYYRSPAGRTGDPHPAEGMYRPPPDTKGEALRDEAPNRRAGKATRPCRSDTHTEKATHIAVIPVITTRPPVNERLSQSRAKPLPRRAGTTGLGWQSRGLATSGSGPTTSGKEMP